ncbi:MAG: (Fe-S)-binding protein [Nitrospinae bacterium]|nr:(Fe-S)-binding protein [Nitrospinota bacterium]
MYDVLEIYREEFYRCIKCGSCQPVCPTYIETRDESMVARGRLALSEAVVEGRLGLTDGLMDRVSKCLSCMACSESCPTGVDVVKLLTAVRSQVVEDKGLDPISKVVLRVILKNNRLLSFTAKLMGLSVRLYNFLPSYGIFGRIIPFVRNGIKRVVPPFGGRHLRKGLPEVLKVEKPKMRVAFYTGCMTDMVYQDVGRGVISVLKKLNIEIVLPQGQVCCGAPAYYMGDRKTATELAKSNIEVFKDLKVDAIINCCATCGTMLKEVYPLLLDKDAKGVSDKTVDIQKFIADRLEIFKIRNPKSEILNPVRVTYHDPCHLKRGQGVVSAPREILKSIPGIEYVEMKDADRCCGGSGTFSLKYYDFSMAIGKYKAEKIRESGADIVATDCPSCQMQLTDILNRYGVKAKVVHTVQLLAGSLS